LNEKQVFRKVRQLKDNIGNYEDVWRDSCHQLKTRKNNSKHLDSFAAVVVYTAFFDEGIERLH
jgi:hypothetical protein